MNQSMYKKITVGGFGRPRTPADQHNTTTAQHHHSTITPQHHHSFKHHCEQSQLTTPPQSTLLMS
jgi:hypothetical protein